MRLNQVFKKTKRRIMNTSDFRVHGCRTPIYFHIIFKHLGFIYFMKVVYNIEICCRNNILVIIAEGDRAYKKMD